MLPFLGDADIDIKQLKYLHALAETSHFTRAAEQCHITQPTLSLRIKQLEDELGVPLIKRGNRFGGFTPEGEQVLAWAQKILNNCDGLYQSLSAYKGELSGRLRLGVIPSAIPYISRLTSPFLSQNPKVMLSTHSISSNEMQQKLNDFALDVGITYLDNEPVGSRTTLPLYTEEHMLLIPEDAFIAEDQTDASWEEAAQLPLCLLTPEMQNRRIIDTVFERIQCQVKPRLESNSTLALYSHVQTGQWATIASSIHIKMLGLPTGVRALPLHTPDVSYQVGLIRAEADPLPPLVKAFWESVEQFNQADGKAQV